MYFALGSISGQTQDHCCDCATMAKFSTFTHNESTSPSEVAACRKFRLGHVSPGTEQNQWSQTANSSASRLSTGTF